MKFYLKDYNNKIHKIEYSSRDALLERVTCIGKALKEKYREKALYDEAAKSISNRILNMSEKHANSVNMDMAVKEAENIQAIRYDIIEQINDIRYLTSDINPEQELSIYNFIGIGYRFELPEIYEENVEEMGALIESMTGSL